MPQDSYYKDSSHIAPEERSKINFDEPAAIEWTLLVDHLKKLKEGTTIEMPTYSYLTCTSGRDSDSASFRCDNSGGHPCA